MAVMSVVWYVTTALCTLRDQYLMMIMAVMSVVWCLTDACDSSLSFTLSTFCNNKNAVVSVAWCLTDACDSIPHFT